MKKILIADDEPSLRFILKEVLESKEYDIYEACDGEEAFDMFMKNDPDVVLLDVSMPKMSGYEVAEKISRNNKRCKVIMISARAQKKDIELGFENGIDYYVTKPFDLFELSNLIDRAASGLEL